MKTFSFSDLNRHPGEVVDAALAAPVTLTKRGKAKLVMMNAETWQILRHGRAFTVEEAPQEIVDLLLDGLENAPTGN